MKIKEVEIKNFKSFSRRVKIPILEGFTVISGPNGSGKSNIIDAIVFALGLSSSRALRAEKLTDLINSSNGARRDYAEVTIVFDNSDHKIPVEENEVRVTRRIRETEGGYYSYYYLNSSPTTLSDIHHRFSFAGLYGDGYNVVMQGDVTRIIEMTPLERRRIIDDISGVSEFDAKKEQALKELEIVGERIEKVNIILGEVEKQLQQLEKDRSQAIQYRELVDRRNTLEKYRLAHEYKSLDNRIKRVERDIQRLQKTKDKNLKEYNEISIKISDLERKVEEINEAIIDKGEVHFQQIKEEIQSIRTEINSLKQNISINKGEIERLSGEKTRVLLKISQIGSEIKSLENEINTYTVQKASVQGVVDDLQEQLVVVKARLGQMDEKFEELKRKLFELKSRLDSLKDERAELVRHRDRLLDSVRRYGMEMEENEANLENLSISLSRLQEEMAELSREMSSIDKKIKEMVEERDVVDRDIFRTRDKLSALDDSIRDGEVKLAAVKARIKAAEESAYSKSVETILEARKKKVLPGIYGTVADLGKVPEEYATALSVAAGNSMQFVVVDSEEDAVRAIKYLKEIKGGRATFLPLNMMKRKFGKIRLDKDHLGIEGVIDYAINLVSFEEKFRPIFNFIFRDTLVVTDIDTAKRILQTVQGELRMVTLDGDLVEKSGAMTGGSKTKTKFSFLADSRRELIQVEEELAVLYNSRKGINLKLSKLEETRRTILSNLQALQEERERKRRELESKRDKIDEIKGRISLLKEGIEKVKEEKDRISSEMSEIELKIEEKTREISSIETKIADIEKTLKGSEIPKLARKIEELKGEIETNSEVLRKIETTLQGLTAKKQTYEQSLADNKEIVEEIEKRMASLKDDIESYTDRIETLTAELEKKFEAEKSLSEELGELREQRDTLMKEISELEKKKNSLKIEQSVIEEKIAGKMEILDELKIQIEEYEVEEIEELPPIKEISAELKEVERKINEMGDVNLKAIQEYDEVYQRREDLVAKRDTLVREKEEISNRIEKYEMRKREVFFETFNAINRNFMEIFAQLSDGTGELVLENPENPFEGGMHIHVKPHGKPIQRLESMSGGEKSLVAISLIFAIQRFKPAPFYVFDEIDMFLDGVNVDRVARLIKDNSKDAQFIVVSLRKPMIEKADSIIGVTMSNNTTIVTGVKLN